ncbi:hypothetical protein [Candidatus Poriferisodalis sp.]|uniref:hypothetical protein n=1 Tax=Candidatus Poriferisodalis sp. TaxID=3101277 RepID=UPI003B02864B
MSSVVRGLDRIEAVFDEGTVVGDTGLLLAGTLAGRLGGGGGWVRAGGAADFGDVLAVLHVGPCAPAGPRRGTGVGPRVGCWRRACGGPDRH